MKRIELNTGSMEKGFWNGNKFDYKLKSKVGSHEYNFDEDKCLTQVENAKEFMKNKGDSIDAIEIWDVASEKEVFIFEIEDVDKIIEDSPSDEFLIYLETKGENLFICTTGIRNGAIPKGEFPQAGDYKKFTKTDLKEGYLSAKQNFETNKVAKGGIKLNIHQLPKST